MSLNELAKEAHQISVEHGWWDKEPTFGELVALMHSELSEALEEYRAGRPMVYFMDVNGFVVSDMSERRGDKLEGIAVELADCIIRILDWAGHEGVDMDKVLQAIEENPMGIERDIENKFGDFISDMHNLLSMAYSELDVDERIYLCMVINYIQEAMKKSGINLDAIIREKMEYNRTRPYRHGGKVL